jgi:uncharacterized protein Yka (UPF0111/DUF47 family)
MDFAIRELYRTQKYHLRQLEDNLSKIKSYQEAIETLKQGNETHRKTIEEIGQAIEMLEKADGLPTVLPVESDSIDSISQKEMI